VDEADRLMARIRRRDAAAFETLYTAYHRLVFGIALRMLGDRPAAEDLTQSVFLKVWSAPDAFQSGNFAAWIARVARNRALDVLRSRASHPVGELAGDLAHEESLDEVVFTNVNAEAVRSALAALPEEQRVLIDLGFFAGITHEELARRTGTPLGTVKTRIRAGLRKLRAALEAKVSAP
jgi:RNA polymerase sigma-70 factor (ECF subfamily)